jgi:hypothetical protein
MSDEQKIRRLERRVANLESRLDELVRLLKRSEDEDVQHAARRAQ